VSFGAAIAGGTVVAVAGAGRAAPLIGWDILAVIFCRWVWSTVWRLDAESTASHARREEPSRDLADLVLLGAAIASLIAVGAALFGAGNADGNLKYREAGIDFNEAKAPDYADFAHLSFTIGMTFQVSDTNIESKQIRRTALRHAITTAMMPIVQRIAILATKPMMRRITPRIIMGAS
jgi:uncharacterized membrane protein